MPELRGRRILIVEDEADVRTVMTRFSERLGCEVTASTDGQAAWAMLAGAETAPFDLVLTDHRMPRMTGGSLIELIRGRFPQLPIVRVTGDFGVLDEPALPGVTWLAKPFTVQEFRRAIERALA